MSFSLSRKIVQSGNLAQKNTRQKNIHTKQKTFHFKLVYHKFYPVNWIRDPTL